jgi:hypothetical protein
MKYANAIAATCLTLSLAGCQASQVGGSVSSPTPSHIQSASTTTPGTASAKPPKTPKKGENSSQPSTSKDSGIHTQRIAKLTDLKLYSRPFEGTATVRQSTIHPIPKGTDSDTKDLIEDILTFDPNESELVYMERVKQSVSRLYRQKNFEALDLVADTLRKKRILGHSGTWAITYFYNSLDQFESENFKTEAATHEKWCKSRPKSVAARLSYGKLLTNWAWDARGTDWADTVTEKAWELFHERLTLALSVLEQATDIEKDPYVYAQLMIVAKGLQLSPQAVKDYLSKAQAIDSVHIYSYYTSYADRLLLRWEGKPGEYQAFVEESVKKTRPEIGETLYAILMTPHIKTDTEKEVGVDRKRCLRAYEDLLKKNPRSFYNFAAYLELTEFVEGPEQAWKLLDRVLNGNLKMPLSLEERRALEALGESKYLSQFKPDKDFNPSLVKSVSLNKLSLGMTRGLLENVAGKPWQVMDEDEYSEFRYGVGGSFTGAKLYKKSGKVEEILSSTLVVDGKEFAEKASYKDVLAALGPPAMIKGSTAAHFFYPQYNLWIGFSAGKGESFIYIMKVSAKDMHRTDPRMTLDDWTKTLTK